jgi:hypothetical protein
MKTALGIIATVMAFVSYIPYIRNMLSGKTKPHAFSWLVWGTLTAIAFVGQVTDGAGPGAWVTGFTAFVSFFIFITALRTGEKDIEKSDWLSLIGAGVAMLLWWATSDPLIAVILITLIDALGFFPTFRKSYHKPYQETAITFAISGLKFVIAIIALENLTPTTWLYPASLVIMNGIFVVMLLIRRKQVGYVEVPL